MQPPQFITPNNRVLAREGYSPASHSGLQTIIIGGRLHQNLIHYDCINPASARGKYVREDRLTLEAVCAATILPGNLTQPVRILAGTGN
ncbi:hypothetical protein BDW60DRAFT_220936 [Aspergillus nidulans var. acristatus]